MDWLGFAFTPAGIVGTLAGALVAGLLTGLVAAMLSLVGGRSSRG